MSRATLAIALVMILAIPTSALMAQKDAPANLSHAARAAKTDRGKELFAEYCASCHGDLGKGDGPVARTLKDPPTDLTSLTARNQGQFPAMRVTGAIKAGPGVPTHGSQAMPVWGPVFMDADNSAREREAELMVYNLVEYIRALQTK